MQKEHKLCAKHQLALCSLLGTGYNPERCKDIFEEEYGITISPQNIRKNYLGHSKWRKIINYMAKRAQREILKHPLAIKINRINILKDAINEAFTWRLDKVNYDKQGNELSRVEKRNIGMVAQLIAEARKEIEGDRPLIDQSQKSFVQIFNNIPVSERDSEIKNRMKVNAR